MDWNAAQYLVHPFLPFRVFGNDTERVQVLFIGIRQNCHVQVGSRHSLHIRRGRNSAYYSVISYGVALFQVVQGAYGVDEGHYLLPTR